jgi:hypothetical protein
LKKGDIGMEMVAGAKTNDVIDKIVRVEPLQLVDSGEGWVRYYLNLQINRSGMFNYTFRIFPTNPMLPHRQDLPLVKWI